MKRLWMVLFCVFMLSGCSSSDKAEGGEDGNGGGILKFEENYNGLFGGSTMTENYSIYHSSEGQLLLFDVKSGTSVPYCFDPSCEHLPPVTNLQKVIREGCHSYSFSPNAFSVRADEGYFLGDCQELIRTDREGKNQKEIARIEKPFGFVQEEKYTENDYFVAYYSPYEYEEVVTESGEKVWIPGGFAEKQESGIYRITLPEGKITNIFSVKEYNSMTMRMCAYGEHLYFVCFYSDVPSSEYPSATDWERYMEFYRMHTWVELYDYDLKKNDLKLVLKEQTGDGFYWGKDFMLRCKEEEGCCEIYEMNGELIKKLELPASTLIYSSDELLYYTTSTASEYGVYDPKNDKIIQKISSDQIPGFHLYAVLGNSYYGNLDTEHGQVPVYINGDDFWKGNIEAAIRLE